MDSIPRRWVLKPLSPLLQPSDLRSLAGPVQSESTGPDDLVFTYDSTFVSSRLGSPQQCAWSGDVVVQARQVALQHGGDASDEWRPSSPGSPGSSGSHCGFYSFVEDPESPEAELNEAWMVSPQRQVQLATLKEDKVFKLQTYAGGRKPESLFADSSGDSPYEVDPRNGTDAVYEEEEKQLRQEIIRSQAPKKSFRDQWSALETLDLSRLVPGFSLSYSSARSGQESFCAAEPGTVVQEQINFSAARQQFLQMEQDRLTAAGLMERDHLTAPGLMERDHLTAPGPMEQDHLTAPGPMERDRLMPPGPMERDCLTVPPDPMERLMVPPGHTLYWWIYSNPGDFLVGIPAYYVVYIPDHEVNLYFSVSLTLSRQGSVFEDLGSGLEEQQENRISYETPIEREIRLVQEREENLRRSRGLKLSDGRAEMVQIRTKRLASPLTPGRARERSRGGFIIQKENHGGGLGPGTHNMRVGQSSLDPLQVLEDIKTELNQPNNNDRTAEGHSESMLACFPHRHPEDTKLYLRRMSPEQSYVSETNSDIQDASGFSRHQTTRILLKDQSSPSSPTSSSCRDLPAPTPQRSAAPRSWRENLESTGLTPRGRGTPDFIEKEIEEALRRERELKELREKRGGRKDSGNRGIKEDRGNSEKFSRKIQFVQTLQELSQFVPIERLQIPDAIRQ
ncbi:LOW QUALITY PROTEIN: mitotic interactor and substrate of PLK1 [Etheostoma cragini]|uniref:LOW QUALITY PROTEIN: mitotic interactor and substrate of PLK1 n=1 Tax=Etheostoma cragini TaxID=417921 RepID=UPI00155DFFDF|nr:LOW QUALITY PROTEIN: mitotic interactor and substrate of PLK1 [Etheostoma cragini]